MINIVGKSPIPNIIKTIGTHAIGEIGRKRLNSGSKALANLGLNPNIKPTKTPKITPNINPKIYLYSESIMPICRLLFAMICS